MRPAELLGRLFLAALLLGLLSLFPQSPDRPIDPGILFFLWFLVLSLGRRGLRLEALDDALLFLHHLPFLMVAAALAGRSGGMALVLFLLGSLATAEAILALEYWLRPRGPDTPSLIASLLLAAPLAYLISGLERAGKEGPIAYLAGILCLLALFAYLALRRVHARRGA